MNLQPAVSDKFALEISNLTLESDSGAGSGGLLVRNINLQARRGRVLGIIGESGSGKTMTCLAAMGLLPQGVRVVSGGIRLNGEELTALSGERRRLLRGSKMAIVMQNPMAAFNPVRTIGSHMLETIRVHARIGRRQAADWAAECLNSVNLPEPRTLLKRYPFELSGGMLQRIMIAIALSGRPDVLFADEPTTALDAGNRKHVLMELERFRRMTGAAIVLVTHDLGVIAELADDVAVMYRGDLVETGAVSDIFDRPSHPYTRRLLNESNQM